MSQSVWTGRSLACARCDNENKKYVWDMLLPRLQELGEKALDSLDSVRVSLWSPDGCQQEHFACGNFFSYSEYNVLARTTASRWDLERYLGLITSLRSRRSSPHPSKHENGEKHIPDWETDVLAGLRHICSL